MTKSASFQVAGNTVAIRSSMQVSENAPHKKANLCNISRIVFG